MKRLKKDDFIRKARFVHGNKYIYDKTEYKNNHHERMIITCPQHGDFIQDATHHIDRKQGCPKCSEAARANQRRTPLHRFVEMARLIHGDKYGYGKVNYKNNLTKIVIICLQHGEFLQTPGSHLSGRGCAECVGLKKITTEEFIRRANVIHGKGKYNYSAVVYNNSTSKVTIICRKHGAFLQTPVDHVYSRAGCPDCQKSKGELWIAQILNDRGIYYIKQKTFPDCLNLMTRCRLKYDFFVPSHNILIEYNGEQHYLRANHWFITEKSFEYLQYRDALKKEYAIKNGYKFLVLKYDDKNIEQNLLKAVA